MAALPKAISPMLATLVKDPPAGNGWIHELKLDGYRIIAHVDRGKVQLLTRNGKDWTERYASIAGELTGWRSTRAVLDGEVVVLLPDGRTSFEALQNISAGRGDGALLYYVFDLLHDGTRDLTNRPLVERKALLQELLEQVDGGEDCRVRFSDHVRGSGSAFFDQACAMRLEGIISKRADSHYTPGRRSPDWVKVKCINRQEFVILGYTEPSGSRSGFGALLIGYYQDGELTYAGRVGTGFTGAQIDKLMRKFRPLETHEPPLRALPDIRTRTPVHWLRPDLVAEIAFTEWTGDGVLRHPSFQGLREDRSPKSIVRETPR